LPIGEDKFYSLLGQAADNVLAAGLLLVETMDDFAHLGMRADRMRELEHQGDFLTHQVMNQLQKSFVTPIDREDIALLAQRLDDVLDHIEAAVTALCDYEIAAPTPTAREMAAVIQKTGTALQEAMAHIRRADLKAVLPITVVRWRSTASKTRGTSCSGPQCVTFFRIRRTCAISSNGAKCTTSSKPRPTAPKTWPTSWKASFSNTAKRERL